MMAMGLIYSVDAFQVDKLEQAENVRSEEEQKAEERPIVFGINIYSLPPPTWWSWMKTLF